MSEVISVSQLNKYIKAVFDENDILKNIYVSGEISNFKDYYRSGHYYFTLKDENAAIKCVMFSSHAQKLKFKPEDGMKVVCRGRVSVYEKSGEYQIYAEDMQPLGTGSYLIAYNQLKERLEKKGFFDESNKKPLPYFPQKIGVATSLIGDAVEDIKNISARRYPLAELVIVQTKVQGENAPNDIASSIKMLDEAGVDVIIVGRGGGSIEDLWAFNSEIVAQSIYECSTPVVSAVGHEADFTICDLVADKRAPTPSAAAEIICPDISTVYKDINTLKEKLNIYVNSKIDNLDQEVSNLSNSSVLTNCGSYVDMNLAKVDEYYNKIVRRYSDGLENCSLRYSSLVDSLEALSPLAVLKRGYTYTTKNDAIVRNSDELNIDDNISVTFHDGKIKCIVKEVDPFGNQ